MLTRAHFDVHYCLEEEAVVRISTRMAERGRRASLNHSSTSLAVAKRSSKGTFMSYRFAVAALLALMKLVDLHREFEPRIQSA